MRKFEFYNPTKLIFGQGTLQALRTEVPKYGKNVLLMYGAAASSAAVFMIMCSPS